MPTNTPRGPRSFGPRTFRGTRSGVRTAETAASAGGSGDSGPSSSILKSFQIHLDMRIKLRGTYSAATNRTTFVSPVPFYGDVAVYLHNGTVYTLTANAGSLTIFSAAGDLSLTDSILGTQSPMNVDLSEIVARDAQDKPEIGLGVLLQRVTLLHLAATGFNVQVSHSLPALWPTESRAWSPDLTAAQTVLYNRFRVRIGTVAERSTISIAEATWKPVQINGLEVEYEAAETIR